MLNQILIAIRRLASRPAFAIAAVATLAVGIGATTAIFSAVNATLLRPLPYPNADEIYAINTRLIDGRYTSGWDRLAGAQIVELNESSQTVDQAVLFLPGEFIMVNEDGTTETVTTASVSEGFFDLFGLPLALGRAFNADEHGARSIENLGAIISYRLWQRMYGGDADISTLRLRSIGPSVPIVGVTAPEFDAPPGTDLFIPMSFGDNISHNYQGYLRVVPGTTREALEAELPAVMARVVERFPISTGRTFVTRTLVESIVGDLGPILVIVLGGAILLLVLGCVNVATLILGRGATQTREMAIYAALGASRGRIIGRFLIDGVILSAIGTVLGLLLAYAGVRALFAYAGARLPRLDSIPFDMRVLGFALLTMAVATILIGLLPAIRLSTPDIRGLINEGGRSASASRGSRRLLGGLVVAEIALAITLVAGAGWLVRGYVALSERDLGFTPAGRLLFEAVLPSDTAAIRNLAEQLPERLAALDQVRAIGSGASLPLQPYTPPGVYVAVPGEPYDPNRQDVGLAGSASPQYFDALGVRLLAGRLLTEADRPPPPEIIVDPETGIARIVQTGPPPLRMVVVNQGFADRYFPGQNAIGRRFATGVPLVNFESLYEVVGVVENVQYGNLTDPVRPIFYSISTIGPARIVLATDMKDPTELIPTIRSAVADIDPSIQAEITLLSDLVTDALAPYRLGLVLMLLFAVVSLGLAAIGIIGVVAHTTSERTRELATRAALGTTPGGIVALIVRQARSHAVLGTALGAVAAVIGGRIVSSRIYEVPARDPVILIVAGLAVLAITLLAYVIPAVRAARITPAVTLKVD